MPLSCYNSTVAIKLLAMITELFGHYTYYIATNCSSSASYNYYCIISTLLFCCIDSQNGVCMIIEYYVRHRVYC